jgi:hypothetical protein
MYCSYCGKNTHTLTNCPKTWAGSVHRRQLRCGYCGAKDHALKACPKTYAGNAARSWYPDKVADHFIVKDFAL